MSAERLIEAVNAGAIRVSSGSMRDVFIVGFCRRMALGRQGPFGEVSCSKQKRKRACEQKRKVFVEYEGFRTEASGEG